MTSLLFHSDAYEVQSKKSGKTVTMSPHGQRLRLKSQECNRHSCTTYCNRAPDTESGRGRVAFLICIISFCVSETVLRRASFSEQRRPPRTLSQGQAATAPFARTPPHHLAPPPCRIAFRQGVLCSRHALSFFFLRAPGSKHPERLGAISYTKAVTEKSSVGSERPRLC